MRLRSSRNCASQAACERCTQLPHRWDSAPSPGSCMFHRRSHRQRPEPCNSFRFRDVHSMSSCSTRLARNMPFTLLFLLLRFGGVEGRCAPGEFACYTGNQCIPRIKWQDDVEDCWDGSDERGCLPLPNSPSNFYN
ncbi:hypothetical protein Aduo_009078 [Ancylostoma duodenale]